MNKLKDYLINNNEQLYTYLRLFFKLSHLPENRFIIFAQTRTGSNLLQNLLNSHPEVYCDGEILWDLSKSRLKKVDFPYLYINGKSISTKKLKVYGCNIKINQTIEYSDWLSLMSNLYRRNWKIIYINRLNLLRQSISELIAQKSNVWIAKESQNYDIKKHYINCEQLIKTIELHKHYGEKELKILENLPHLKVVYENDLFSSDQHQYTLNQIFNYLEIKAVSVKTNLINTSAEKMSDVIDNYDEFRGAIAKTEYKSFLNDF